MQCKSQLKFRGPSRFGGGQFARRQRKNCSISKSLSHPGMVSMPRKRFLQLVMPVSSLGKGWSIAPTVCLKVYCPALTVFR